MTLHTCVLEPLGTADAPTLALTLARTRWSMTRRRMRLIDLDTTGRLRTLLEGVRAPPPTMADVLRGLSRFEAIEPGHKQVDRVELVSGGGDLDLAWQELTSAALATGFAISVADQLRSALESPDDARERLLLAPPGMGPLSACVLAASDRVVIVVPEHMDGLPEAMAWVRRVLRARDLEGPDDVILVSPVRIRSATELRNALAEVRRSWEPLLAELHPFQRWPLAAADQGTAARNIWHTLLGG